MSKPKRKRKKHHGGGGPAVAPSRDAALDELDAQVARLAATDDVAEGPLWGTIHKLLLKAKADPMESGRIVANRDEGLLAAMIAALRAGESAPAPRDEPAAAPAVTFDPEDLRHAMRAFKRRVRLMRLDDESKLGVNPLTGGRHSEIGAIIPPQEFPAGIWDALVADGRLRAMGGGFYEVAEEG